MRSRLWIVVTACLVNVIIVNGQDSNTAIWVTKDFNDSPFIDFAEEIQKTTKARIYFFDGWVRQLRIVQDTIPVTLDRILSTTLDNSGFYYYRNSFHQYIITRTPTTNFQWQVTDQPESKEVNESSDSLLAIFQEQQGVQKDWVVLGDPSSPEQLPALELDGFVRNLETQEPLEGAIIYVEELQTGTTTDSLGYYRLSLPQGRYAITFQSIGLKESTKYIQCFASGRVNAALGELIMNIEEVIVRADRRASILNVQMGVEALKTETIKELPTLLGEVDIVRSALLLPGVQTVGEFTSGINVRGGGSDQNLILLNGAPVFNAAHLFGFSSSFSPDVIEGFELYKSSIPAKYGGRISSVLEIDLKEGDSEHIRLRGGISPVTTRMTVEGPIQKDHSSFIISGRTTYSDWILGRIENASFRNSTANYSDINAYVQSDLGRKGSLEISSYWSNDDFQLNGDTTYNYKNGNIAIHYRHAFNEQLFGNFSGHYSNYSFNVSSVKSPEESFDLFYKIEYLEGKSHFTWAPHPDHIVDFGLSLVDYNLDPGQIDPALPESLIKEKRLETEHALEGSMYISNEWTLSDKVSIYGGLRLTTYTFLGPNIVNDYSSEGPRTRANITGSTSYGEGEVIQRYTAPEFRTSFRYSFNDVSSVKASFNRNRQYLSMLFNSATVSPTATWKLSDRHLLPQTGNQFSLGYYRNMLDDRLEFSVEGYYKQIDHMLDFKAGAQLFLNEQLETDVVNGEGRTYGVELLLKKNGRKLNGWISYTYSKSRFRSTSEFVQDQINQGEWFDTNYDKPHDFSLVGFYRVSRRFSISNTVAYSTGRPVTVPVAKYEFAGGTRLQYSRRNEFRVPDYFRWDISINLEGSHRKDKFAHNSWSISVYNITGRKNVYSTYFVSDGQDARGYQLSIFGQPFFTLTYNFRM